MKTTISRNDFIRAFKNDDNYKDQFSSKALNLIFDYLQEIDENMDFDMIAICCNFTESTLDDINNDFDKNFKSLSAARKFLEEQTNVIGVTNDSIVYENF